MVKGDSEHVTGGCASWAVCILNHRDNNCKKKQEGKLFQLFTRFIWIDFTSESCVENYVDHADRTVTLPSRRFEEKRNMFTKDIARLTC